MRIEFEKKGYQFQVETDIDEKAEVKFIVTVKGEKIPATAFCHSKVGWGFQITGEKVGKIFGNDDIFLIHPEAEKFWEYREKMKEEKKQQALQEGIPVIFRQKVSDYDWPSIPLEKMLRNLWRVYQNFLLMKNEKMWTVVNLSKMSTVWSFSTFSIPKQSAGLPMNKKRDKKGGNTNGNNDEGIKRGTYSL